MSVRLDTPALRIIEDYAHHPTEVRESLKALRKTNPGKRMVVVFQPHRYARLERYFEEFAKELSVADLLFIQPVFAAWTGKGRYTSDDLALAAGGTALHGTMEGMASDVQKSLRHGDLLCVLGAGDGKDLISYFLKKPFDN
jgi:UDP-N-acetylmuramate--alanine ligase